jgi:hypothetical protein
MTARRLYSILGAAIFAASVLVVRFSSAVAQTALYPSPDELIKQTHDAFQKAKNKIAMESIEAWCRDNLALFSYDERNWLTLEALSSAQQNKIDEENAALRRVNELKELDKNLGDMSCKPTAIDEAIRRSHATRKK